MDKCLAYYREKRKVYGVRNHVLILPTTFCVNNVAYRIWSHFAEEKWGEYEENKVVLASHDAGCCHVGFDREVAFRTFLGVASNPNVYGVLLVSLGCGQFCKPPLKPGEDKKVNLMSFELYDRLVKRGVKVKWVNVQEAGFEKAVKIGVKHVERMIKEARKLERVECPLDKIVIGVGNGASDPTSGLFANPAVGHLVDYFIEKGGTVVFSQSTEVLGAEEYLFSKVRREKTKLKLKRLLETLIVFKEGLEEYLGVSDPTPGNIESGISTLAEKSLGTVLKIGHSRKIEIKDVLSFAEKVPRNGGLYFMDGPGEDLLAITGIVAGGAHAVIFTTGLGTPIGSVVAPIIKVTANKETFTKLADIIDVYIPVEKIFEEKMTLKELAVKVLYDYLLKILSGEPCKAEKLGQMDFGVREYWMKL
ncbi:MAG TPA: hypothetical protein ENF55_02160 [Thermoprotei archaeon]|nr:hypothetical protein [Thermoprotei archaeon]